MHKATNFKLLKCTVYAKKMSTRYAEQTKGTKVTMVNNNRIYKKTTPTKLYYLSDNVKPYRCLVLKTLKNI